MSRYERLTRTTEPFDCILGRCANPDCPGGPDLGGGSHGRGSGRETWIVRGEGLAVCWTFSNGVYLPESIEAMGGIGPERPGFGSVSYHAATQLGDHDGRHPDCDWLGMPCWHDGSFVDADRYAELHASEGEEAAWQALEDYWQATFNQLMARMSGADRG